MAGKTRRPSPNVIARRQRVYEAWCRLESQNQIAAKEGVHPGQISRDLDVILADLPAPSDKEARRLEALARLAHIDARLWRQYDEAMAAWERSKEPRERKRAKTTKGGGKDGQGKRDEQEKVIEARDGNPKFLEVARQVQAELRHNEELRAKLLGLIVHKVAPVTPDGDKPAVLKIEVIPSGQGPDRADA